MAVDLDQARYCANPECGKVLEPHQGEWPYQFRNRVTCGKHCGTVYGGKKGSPRLMRLASMVEMPQQVGVAMTNAIQRVTARCSGAYSMFSGKNAEIARRAWRQRNVGGSFV